jgi:hypothetical protein
MLHTQKEMQNKLKNMNISHQILQLADSWVLAVSVVLAHSLLYQFQKLASLQLLVLVH